MKKIIFGAFAIFIFFSGCKSIPLPDGPTDSLLIIPCEIEKTFRDGEWVVNSVSIVLRNIDTKKEYRMISSPGKDYSAISLPPGGYRSVKTSVSITKPEHKYTEIQDQHISAISFFLESNIIFFANDTVNLKRNRDWYHIYSTRIYRSEYRTNRLTTILDEFKQGPKWAAWENAKIIGLE